MNISLSAFVPENLVSRDGFGSPVPRQPAHLHTQAESGAYLLRDFSRVPRRRMHVIVVWKLRSMYIIFLSDGVFLPLCGHGLGFDISFINARIQSKCIKSKLQRDEHKKQKQDKNDRQ